MHACHAVNSEHMLHCPSPNSSVPPPSSSLRSLCTLATAVHFIHMFTVKHAFHLFVLAAAALLLSGTCSGSVPGCVPDRLIPGYSTLSMNKYFNFGPISKNATVSSSLPVRGYAGISSIQLLQPLIPTLRKGSILFAPGFQLPVSSYANLTQFMVSWGLEVYAFTPSTLNFNNISKQLSDFVINYKLRKVTCVGHSKGGGSCYSAAGINPDIRGMVGLDPVAGNAAATAWLAAPPITTQFIFLGSQFGYSTTVMGQYCAPNSTNVFSFYSATASAKSNSQAIVRNVGHYDFMDCSGSQAGILQFACESTTQARLATLTNRLSDMAAVSMAQAVNGYDKQALSNYASLLKNLGRQDLLFDVKSTYFCKV